MTFSKYFWFLDVKAASSTRYSATKAKTAIRLAARIDIADKNLHFLLSQAFLRKKFNANNPRENKPPFGDQNRGGAAFP